MQTIPNVTTAADYTTACTLEDLNAVAGTYVVANAAVVAQFRPKRPDGSQADYGPELLLSPQSNNLVNVAGMRFRDAVPGVHAQVIAALFDRADALPGAATPFSQSISPSGSVTPGTAAVQIQKDGALVGSEPILDFVTGAGIKLTASDDPANTRVLLTIAAAAIADTTLGAPAGSIDVQNIGVDYSALRLLHLFRSTAGGAGAGLFHRFNNDAAGNYTYMQAFYTNGVGLSPADAVGSTIIYVGDVVAAGAPANRASAYTVDVPNYASVTFHKEAVGHGGQEFADAGGSYRVWEGRGVWRSTAAVNRVTVLLGAGNIDTGSRFTIEKGSTT